MYLISMLADTISGDIYFDILQKNRPKTQKDMDIFKQNIANAITAKKRIVVNAITVINILNLDRYEEREIRNVFYHIALVANTSEGMFFKDMVLSECPTNQKEVAFIKGILKDHIRKLGDNVLVLDIVILNIQPIIDSNAVFDNQDPGLLEKIKSDIDYRMSQYTDSRHPTTDEVSIAWLISEVERLQSIVRLGG